MMSLNCCNFSGLRRPGGAPAAASRPSVQATVTDLADVDSHWPVPIRNPPVSPPVQAPLCSSRSLHLPPFLLSAAAFSPLVPKTSSPTAIPKSLAWDAPSPALRRAQGGCSTSRHNLPAFPVRNFSRFRFPLGSLSFRRGTRLGTR